MPAPTIASYSTDSGTAGDGITNDNTLTLTGTAAANSTVNVYDGFTLLGSITADGAGGWSFTTTALTDGGHSLTATATDSNGNTSAASVALNVTIDTTPPTQPTITAFAANGVLSGTAEANSTIKIYDGATLLGTTAASSGGAWNFTATTGVRHDFTVIATDVAGNASPSSWKFMVGGPGNDNFVVSSPNDIVVESANGGSDIVFATVSGYTLPANVEVGALTVAGTLTANAAGDILYAGPGAATLIGGVGNDTFVASSGIATMIGGAGNDTYYVNDVNDVVTENAGGGNDIVIASVSGYTLTANVEIGILSVAGTLTANAAGSILYGGAGTATLNGGVGNDTLVAGSGIATLSGGVGNDIYSINNLNDVIIEKPGEGTDTVLVAVSGYTLPTNVEVGALTVAGTLTANAAGDVLYAGPGSATLIGGIGNDVLVDGSGTASMIGGAGNDVYYVKNVNDVVTENANGGSDTVVAMVSGYTMADNVEVGMLTVAGTLTGNSTGSVLYAGPGPATLIGGVGNDVFVAGSGATTMIGGAGNDVYYVKHLTDVVTESANGGNDTVAVSVSGYTLSANVEVGVLQAAGTLTASSTGSTLVGSSGNDTLISQAGNDVLVGGAGNDTFVFNLANGNDTITDFDKTNEVIDLHGYAAAGVTDFASLMTHVAQVGNNTVITFDASNTITLANVQLNQLHQSDFIFS